MPGRPPIGKPDLNRLRVSFGKDGRLAYLGHIEIINTIMRSVRRAGLHFSVGNGFARRMRIQFSQALPVGAASTCECYDLYLTERVDADEALAALADSSPTALAPTRAAYVGSRLPALEAWLTRSLWQVRILGSGAGFDAASLDASLHELQEVGSIDFMRGDTPRTIGLADTLVGWQARDVDGGRPGAIDLTLMTRSSNLGALRPAVLLDAAFARPCMGGARPDSMRVLRAGQWHEDESGRLVEPFDQNLLQRA